MVSLDSHICPNPASKSWVKFLSPAQRRSAPARRTSSASRSVMRLKRPHTFSQTWAFPEIGPGEGGWESIFGMGLSQYSWVCICICTSMYIYIYICTHVCTSCVYIYIYIYLYNVCIYCVYVGLLLASGPHLVAVAIEEGQLHRGGAVLAPAVANVGEVPALGIQPLDAVDTWPKGPETGGFLVGVAQN